MPYALISNETPADYEGFILESLEAMRNEKVKGIAIVVLTEDNKALTGYWNMVLSDKVQAASEINFDAIDQLIMSNIRRYRNAAEEDEYDEETEET